MAATMLGGQKEIATMSDDPQIQHYRKVEAQTPFSLGGLEAFCATLRAHGCDATKKINCNYQVTLSVRFDEPVLNPEQLRRVV